jgi:hypothetical protein
VAKKTEEGMTKTTEIKPHFVTKSVAEVVEIMTVLSNGQSRFFDQYFEDHVDEWIEKSCLALSYIDPLDQDRRYGRGRLGYAIYHYHGGKICVRLIAVLNRPNQYEIFTALLRKLVGTGRPSVYMNIGANELPILNLLKEMGFKACSITQHDGTDYYGMSNDPNEVFHVS